MKNDHRSKFSNLNNWKEEAWKNQGFNGIRTRDLHQTSNFTSKFKILILVFEVLRNLSPLYLQELISLCRPSRTLRLSAYPRLNCNSYNLESYGPRTF